MTLLPSPQFKPEDPEDHSGLKMEGVWLNLCVKDCHYAAVNAGWYTDLKTGLPKEINIPERLMLMVTELSEAMEGHRKGRMDDKLPHRKMIEVELADCLIRIFDTAGFLQLDLGGAYAEKMVYNSTREDHKLEVRKAGGKQY